MLHVTRRRFIGVGVGSLAALAARPVIELVSVIPPNPDRVQLDLVLKEGGHIRFDRFPVWQDDGFLHIPDLFIDSMARGGEFTVTRLEAHLPANGSAKLVRWDLGEVKICYGNTLTLTDIRIASQ